MNLLPNKSALLLSLLLVGHAATAHAEKSDHDKPIQIASDHLNVDDANRISTFEGKVELTQGTIRVIAEKLVVTEDLPGSIVPQKLSEVGVPEDGLMAAAELALYDGSMVYNPRMVMEAEEVLEVYKKAY